MRKQKWINFWALGLTVACGAAQEPGSTSAGIASVGEAGEDGLTGSTDAGGVSAGGLESTGEPVECLIDDDCESGNRCTVDSRVCLPPERCVVEGDCGEGFTCSEGTCAIGGECGGFQFAIQAVPPNLLILLDRSGSMDEEVEGSSDNRWEVAVAAIERLTEAFDATIRFGLATYSSCLEGGCSAGTIVVPVAASTAASIDDFLSQTVGEGSNDGTELDDDGNVRYLCDSGADETSTGISLLGLVGEPSLRDPDRQNAILLLTDGAESEDCIDDDIDAATSAAALREQSPSVLTFAVGFAGANEDELGDIANEGGTRESYFANDAADLEDALSQIAQSVASCSFALDQTPADEAKIYVFFNRDPAGIQPDPEDGWTYDASRNAIEFVGEACDRLRDGQVADIDIVYGCNMVPIG